MCFYHDYDDYDWIARVYAVDESATSERIKSCHECGLKIPAGTLHMHIHMEEKEDWLEDFRDENGDEIHGPWEEDEGPTPGETDDYRRCSACQKLFQAIEAYEIDEGCSGDETQPAIRELSQAFTDHEDGDRYMKRALKMFPELLLNPAHLVKFQREPEEDDDED